MRFVVVRFSVQLFINLLKMSMKSNIYLSAFWEVNDFCFIILLAAESRMAFLKLWSFNHDCFYLFYTV